MSEPTIPEQYHGTLTGAIKYGCRCDVCRAASRDYQRRWRADHAGQAPDWAHGTLTGYNAYACRCDACSTARREYGRAYRARKRAEAS